MAEENIKSDRIDQVDKLLTEYTEEKLLLKKIKMQDVRLDITTSDIAKMTSDELNKWRFEIALYLTYLQKEINIHRSRSNWAKRAFDVYLDSKAVGFDGYGMVEKRAKAMEHDNYIFKLNKLILESQASLDRLEYLPNRIVALSDIAKDIIWSRRQEQYNAEKNDE